MKIIDHSFMKVKKSITCVLTKYLKGKAEDIIKWPGRQMPLEAAGRPAGPLRGLLLPRNGFMMTKEQKGSLLNQSGLRDLK